MQASSLPQQPVSHHSAGPRRHIQCPPAAQVLGTHLNRITNSKYTVVNFLPLNFALQCSRFMNIYFLIIAALELFPTLTPVNPLTTWIPIIIIFSISAIKEAFEDYHRHQRDTVANTRIVHVLREGFEETIACEDIRPGEIVVVNCNEELPCDLVLIGSGEPSQTSCLLQTSNLDGETDLKPRQSARATARMSMRAIMRLECSIECNPPDSLIYTFHGVLKIPVESIEEALTAENLLLQGTTLRGVDCVYGVAVYLGNETKMGMNKSSRTANKLTKVDGQIEWVTRGLFLSQLIIVIALGAAGDFWEKRHTDVFYLELNQQSFVAQFFILAIRYLLLLSYMIPISLKVTLDLCKYFYSLLIEWDLSLWHEEMEMQANSSTTAEDLGCIEYVLTDKTGTLTENEMILEKVSIGGQRHTLDSDEDIRAVFAEESGLLFARILALCNSVDVRDGHINSLSETPIKQRYIASSPDELALVVGVCQFAGLSLAARSVETVELLLQAESSTNKTTEDVYEKYLTLYQISFSPDRRMHSVLIKLPSGELVLFSKGAEEAILQRCNENYAWASSDTSYFAETGLRTLAIAFRPISQQFFDEWIYRVRRAELIADMEERHTALRSCWDDMEKNLTLVGITGVRDRLQEGVVEAVHLLQHAGIRLWMITGDHRDTAIRIAVNAGICHRDDDLVHVRLSSVESEEQFQLCQQRAASFVASCRPFVLVVDGASLVLLLHGPRRSVFFTLCKQSNNVIACRVSPLQKSDLVQLLREHSIRVLAIGDGGNDVAMIQRAHVGVGINGHEGLQASRAADYSFARFRFLPRLLLLHGRYSYNRTSLIGIYCFHKSIFIACVQIFFTLSNGFSGTSIFDSLSLTLYNALFTALPILQYTMNKDYTYEELIRSPTLYQVDQDSRGASRWRMLSWLALAIYQAIITLGVSVEVFADLGMETCGVAAFVIAVSLQTLNVAMEFDQFNIITSAVLLMQIPLLFFIFSISVVLSAVDASYILWRLCGLPQFWATWLLGVMLGVLPTVFLKLLRLALTRPHSAGLNNFSAIGVTRNLSGGMPMLPFNIDDDEEYQDEDSLTDDDMPLLSGP